MPHTKQQIEALLEAHGGAPRRRWGQNFLIDLNLMRLLVDAAELKGDETVLEVGCGTGSLTTLLAERAGAVVAVEIDPILVQIAGEQLGEYANVTLLHSDVLQNKSTIAPAVLEALEQARQGCGGAFYLMANLPYQAASPLLIDLLLLKRPPEGMFITLQAEVADRILAEPGWREYGLLSILLQGTGSVELLRRIKPTAFWPMPNVYSAMLCWRRDQEKYGRIQDFPVLRQVIAVLLGHRRKTIRSCLALHERGTDYSALLHELEIDGEARGETLPPEKFVELANRLAGSEQREIWLVR